MKVDRSRKSLWGKKEPKVSIANPDLFFVLGMLAGGKRIPITCLRPFMVTGTKNNPFVRWTESDCDEHVRWVVRQLCKKGYKISRDDSGSEPVFWMEKMQPKQVVAVFDGKKVVLVEPPKRESDSKPK